MTRPGAAQGIPGFPGYRVTASGDVFGPRGWVLAPVIDEDGHRRVRLSTPEGKRTIGVSVAVLLAWVGDQPDGMVAVHNDGDPGNNHISNLRWATKSDSMAAFGAAHSGEANPSAKLTQDDVEAIRAEYARGEVSQRHLATQYGVAPSAVWNVIHGRTWTNPACAGSNLEKE